MGPVLNIVPPVEERPIPISNKKYSEPLSPAAAIAATARANPHKSRPNSTSSLATVTDTAEDRSTDLAVVHRPRRDKASVVLGIQHRYGALVITARVTLIHIMIITESQWSLFLPLHEPP